MDPYRSTCTMILSLGVLLAGGCSQTVRTLRIQSTVDNFDVSCRLCDFLGRSIAIVPGDAFRGQEVDAHQTFCTTPFSSYASAQTPGTLRYRVDDGPWLTAAGGSELPPARSWRVPRSPLTGTASHSSRTSGGPFTPARFAPMPRGSSL